MFEQTLAVPVRANRACAAMLGSARQSVLMTAAISIPMLFPDSLPRVQTVIGIFAPGPPPPPPPPRSEQAQAPVTRVHPLNPTGVFTEPVKMPPRAVMIDEPPLT